MAWVAPVEIRLLSLMFAIWIPVASLAIDAQIKQTIEVRTETPLNEALTLCRYRY
jgi:hypothetical protein